MVDSGVDDGGRRWCQTTADGGGWRTVRTVAMADDDNSGRQGAYGGQRCVDAKTIFPSLNSQNYIEFRDNMKTATL